MDRICCVKNCGKIVFAKSFCCAHYTRARKYGDPLKTAVIRGDDKARFWSKINKFAPGGCWEWTAKSIMDGYGYFSIGGRAGGHVLAHRYSWEIHNGQIPKHKSYHGYVVMHLCDNRLCVNPDHLRLGTQADNNRDMGDKGRFVIPELRGEEHANHKLTNKDIILIRNRVDLSGPELAGLLGVNRSTINRIRRGEIWKHV